MRTLRLVNQPWVIVPVNAWKNCASSELLYKSNRTQVSMVYRLINQRDASRTLEEFVNHVNHIAYNNNVGPKHHSAYQHYVAKKSFLKLGSYKI